MAAHAHTPGISRSEWIQFAAIGLVAAFAFVLELTHASYVLIFIVAGIAVAGMAHVLGIATEQAGEAAGPRISALLNATFGNAAELIITVVALRQGLVNVVKASIAGSIIGNILIVLGLSLFLGGLKNGTQFFDAKTAGTNATMMMLAVIALSVPAIFAVTKDPFIVYTSNIFAILGLRSMYFMLAEAVARFKYLKYGLSMVLVLIGVKIVWNFGLYKAWKDMTGEALVPYLEPQWSLVATLALIGGSMLYSWIRTRDARDPPAKSDPSGEAG